MNNIKVTAHTSAKSTVTKPVKLHVHLIDSHSGQERQQITGMQIEKPILFIQCHLGMTWFLSHLLSATCKLEQFSHMLQNQCFTYFSLQLHQTSDTLTNLSVHS